MIVPIFSKKLHEFEKILDCWEGVDAGGIAIDPPLVMCSFDQNRVATPCFNCLAITNLECHVDIFVDFTPEYT